MIVGNDGFFDPIELEEDYRTLTRSALYWVPDFSEFLDYWARIDEPKLLAMARTEGRVTGLASFSAFKLPWAIFLGGTRSIRIPMIQAALFGGSVMGSFNQQNALTIIGQLFRKLSFDMLVLANLPMGSGLSEALIHGRLGKLRSSTTRRTARRLIVLPESYEGFLKSLRPSTAKAIRRDDRLFNRLEPTYEVISREEQVVDFVVDAAAVSSVTQKAERGACGTSDTPATRKHLRNLAQQGRLRAYLTRVGGKPVACAWGDVANGVFYFRETAYDPAFAKYSPGRAILLRAVADLIDRHVRVFDFGVIDFGYKERLSNHVVESANVYITHGASPRGWLAVSLQMAADQSKSFVERLGLRK